MTTGSTVAAITALAVSTLLLGPAAASAQTVPGGAHAPSADSAAALSQRVEVARTEYGIPHIFADDWKAFGFAMAWVQSEDYGSQTAIGPGAERVSAVTGSVETARSQERASP